MKPKHPLPILILAAASAASAAAEALHSSFHTEVRVTPSRRAGLAILRREEFQLVLIDESLAGSDEVAAELLYQHAGLAPVVEISFAISSAPRVVRQVRAALMRRDTDLRTARRAAATELQGELRHRLAGLLMESELLLRDAPPSQTTRLRHLVELAGDLRDHLQVSA